MSVWTDFLQGFGVDIVTEFSDKPIGYKAPVKIAGPVYSTVKDFTKLAPDAPGVEYSIAAGNTVASVVAGEIVAIGTKPALAVIAEMIGLTVSAPTTIFISIGAGVLAGIGYGFGVADDVRETVLNMLEDPEWYFSPFEIAGIQLPDGKIIRAAVGSDGNNTYALSNWFDNGFSSFLGLGGNDEIEGNDQENYLWGDNGDDTLVGSAGNDNLFGGAGQDRIDYSQSNSGAVVNLTTGLAIAGGNSVDRLYSIEEVLGTGFADSITGNAQNNQLMGRAGNDTLKGVGGHNILDGGDDSDHLTASDSGDTLIGGTGADIIISGKGADLILLGTTDSYDSLTPLPDNAADRVIYKGGHDQILGSDGAAGGDVLVIDSGNTALGATVSHDGAPLARNFDISFGGSNSLYLDAWGDVIDGSNLQFSDGSMLVYAPEGNGSYSGGAKNDLLIGGTGNTTLTGNAGNDRLQGNAGSDVLNGGNGSDTYVFATGDGTDTVNDAGPNDLLYINTGLFDGEAEKTGSKLCFLIQVACLSGSKEAVCLAG